MPDLPAFHGWTHRPKAQGGTDPIPTTPATMGAIFSYGLDPFDQEIDTANTWTDLIMGGFIQNLDLVIGGPVILVDGSSAPSASGTQFTFVEDYATAVDVFWLIGVQARWTLDGVLIDAGEEMDQDREIAVRVISLTGGLTHLQAGRRIHPQASDGNLEVASDAAALSCEETHWLDLSSERTARHDYDIGAGANALKVQARHTIPYDTGLGVPVVTQAKFWGVRQFRGTA